MSIELRLPNINGLTEREMLSQIKSYLYQIVPQLQWALNNIGSSSENVIVQPQSVPSASASSSSASATPQATFESIKSLIVKSAEIVDAYYEEISRRIEGEYVAQSDFGTFTEQTDQTIIETSTKIESIFSNIQEIVSNIDNIEFSLADVNARIKTGLLSHDGGVAVYGLEVGQTNVIDGVEVFNKYARFTSDRLSFYDRNEIEVAYISDYKIYITHAEVTGTLKLGGYIVDTTKGLTFKWVGRS